MYNINDIVRQAQGSIFPDQEITFINSSTEWRTDSRNPIYIENTITLKGRLQPVDPATCEQLGFNITEYQYYRVYISDITPTQIDKIRKLGATEFIYNNLKYRVVGKYDWDTNGWRELYAYLIDKEKQKE